MPNKRSLHGQHAVSEDVQARKVLASDYEDSVENRDDNESSGLDDTGVRRRQETQERHQRLLALKALADEIKGQRPSVLPEAADNHPNFEHVDKVATTAWITLAGDLIAQIPPFNLLYQELTTQYLTQLPAQTS
ncbi:MAG: hypothetical protein Q9209_002992 [Squamulea sp. 1 TL-2023]